MSNITEYDKWMDRLPGEERAELQGLSQQEIYDRFYRRLEFGTAGMRGVIGLGTNRMNVYTVMQATAGVADTIISMGGEAMERGVVISYDSRRMSEEFAHATASVLAAAGVKVKLFDAIHPVPMLSFAIRYYGAAAGVMITASHNPAQYNGYKVYGSDGAQLEPESAAKTVQAIDRHDYFDIPALPLEEAKASGLVEMIGGEVDEAYYREIGKMAICPEDVAAVPDFKIVYTPLHGSGNIPVRTILERIGVKNVILVDEQLAPDPNFSTVDVPNPEVRQSFDMAIAKANETAAGEIIATDPDADRMGLAVKDGEGNFNILSGNQIGCLLLYHILSAKKAAGTLPANGAVVKTIVSTELASAIAADYGVEMLDVLTGFKFIGEKIRCFEETGSNTFLFGFEESYGYLAGTYARDKDAVAAAMLMTEMAAHYAAEGKSVYDVLQEIYAKYGYYLEQTGSVAYEGAEGMTRMSEIMTRIRANAPKRIGGKRVLCYRDFASLTQVDETGEVTPITGFPVSDCLHFRLEDGAWACIRPSGTEPKIKVYSAGYDRDRDKAMESLTAIQRDMNRLLQ